MDDSALDVDLDVRDNLVQLAAARGVTASALLAELLVAAVLPAPIGLEDREARSAAAVAYAREHLVPDLEPEDLVAGEQLWIALTEGHAISL